MRKGKQPEPDGYEGLADVRIIEGIFKAAATGRAVKIAPVKPQKAIKPSQAIKRPPVPKPSLAGLRRRIRVNRCEAPRLE